MLFFIGYLSVHICGFYKLLFLFPSGLINWTELLLRPPTPPIGCEGGHVSRSQSALFCVASVWTERVRCVLRCFSQTVPRLSTAVLRGWHDAERRRRGEEQGAHPGGAPGERGHRQSPAGPGGVLRHRAARHTLRSGPAEHHVAALRVRPPVCRQVQFVRVTV